MVSTCLREIDANDAAFTFGFYVLVMRVLSVLFDGINYYDYFAFFTGILYIFSVNANGK